MACVISVILYHGTSGRVRGLLEARDGDLREFAEEDEAAAYAEQNLPNQTQYMVGELDEL